MSRTEYLDELYNASLSWLRSETEGWIETEIEPKSEAVLSGIRPEPFNLRLKVKQGTVFSYADQQLLLWRYKLPYTPQTHTELEVLHFGVYNGRFLNSQSEFQTLTHFFRQSRIRESLEFKENPNRGLDLYFNGRLQEYPFFPDSSLKESAYHLLGLDHVQHTFILGVAPTVDLDGQPANPASSLHCLVRI